mmetsp:Transcript_22426/g.32117  ORF Transcript_22426/g.32117 Transcript_22426/m.32117 type:complete len:84 (+) Transcript_22426:1442-1693(+)
MTGQEQLLHFLFHAVNSSSSRAIATHRQRRIPVVYDLLNRAPLKNNNIKRVCNVLEFTEELTTAAAFETEHSEKFAPMHRNAN